MLGILRSRRRPNTTPRTTAPQLGVENLEERSLPAAANYFVLDFTPDYHAGTFRDTFYNVKLSNGKAPAFLDFNKDGWVNDTDVSIAAQQIANRVATFFAPFVNNKANNLTVHYGDVLTQTHMGYNTIVKGIANPNALVAVMYLGGTSSSGSHVLGRAPLAGEGENIEGYGETYTRTIALSMPANATSAQFVDKVAATAAHEFGHMMGLRHSLNNTNNIMHDKISTSPGSTYFVNGWQNTDNGYQQHAYKELDASFQTHQKQIVAPTYSLGGKWLQDSGHPNDDHDHDHMSGCACCGQAGDHADHAAAELFLRSLRTPQVLGDARSEPRVDMPAATSAQRAESMPPTAPSAAVGPREVIYLPVVNATAPAAKSTHGIEDPLGRWSGVKLR